MYKNLCINWATKCHHEKTQLFLLIKNQPQLGARNGPLLKDLIITKHECEAPNSRLTATAKSRHFSKAISVTMPPDFHSAKQTLRMNRIRVYALSSSVIFGARPERPKITVPFRTTLFACGEHKGGLFSIRKYRPKFLHKVQLKVNPLHPP